MMEIVNAKLKTAPCQGACPAGVDVPRYIRFLRAGQFTEALSVVRESIPFPAVCAYACFHPCEVMCARKQYDEAISIRMLKRAAVEFADKDPVLPAVTATGHKVAVIGAGPAGLTAAYYLAGKGHQVTVFEKRAKPGGLMRYGIPEYRLPNVVVDRDIAMIRQRSVEIVTNTSVDTPVEMIAKGFAAVCVATGAWESTGITLPPLDASGDKSLTGAQSEAAVNGRVQVTEGLAFLEAVDTGEQLSVNGKVVVVGGGNTAIDAARAAVRLGAEEATILYRRTRREMPASPEEIYDAEQEGVKFRFLAAPVKLGRGELICTKMTLADADGGGRLQPRPLENSEFGVECDRVILAVGQTAAAAACGLPAHPNGTAVTEAADTLATPISRVFVTGDLVAGPSSVIESIAQGRKVATEIDKLLGGDGLIAEKWVTAKDEIAVDFAPMGQIRLGSQHIALEERTSSFQLAECGLDRQAAMAEAGRCLGCDVHAYEVMVETAFCKDCGYCQEVCDQGVYQQSDDFNAQGYRPMAVVGQDKCVGCLKCLMICPDFALSVGNAAR